METTRKENDIKKEKILLIIGSYLDDSNSKGVFTLDESYDIYLSFTKVLNKCDHDGVATEHLLKASEVSNKRVCGRTLEDSYKLAEACRFLKTFI